ncbi:MAG: hypothetical protein OEY23_14915 [Acidimicrobiia bacterium]|nr:hypothetical protein [Acidimicrobiia bacterium]
MRGIGTAALAVALSVLVLLRGPLAAGVIGEGARDVFQDAHLRAVVRAEVVAAVDARLEPLSRSFVGDVTPAVRAALGAAIDLALANSVVQRGLADQLDAVHRQMLDGRATVGIVVPTTLAALVKASLSFGRLNPAAQAAAAFVASQVFDEPIVVPLARLAQIPSIWRAGPTLRTLAASALAVAAVALVAAIGLRARSRGWASPLTWAHGLGPPLVVASLGSVATVAGASWWMAAGLPRELRAVGRLAVTARAPGAMVVLGVIAAAGALLTAVTRRSTPRAGPGSEDGGASGGSVSSAPTVMPAGGAARAGGGWPLHPPAAPPEH